MPLYESIIIARAQHAKGSTALLKNLATSIIESGGVVRNVEVLSDRVLARRTRGKDMQYHVVGRYMRVLYDGNYLCKNKLEKAAQDSVETIRVNTFKLKDFYQDAINFRKQLFRPTQVVNPHNEQYIQLIREIQEQRQLKEQIEYNKMKL